MSAAAIPAYFELSWAILSTIGLSNVVVGVMVMGIVGFSTVSLVPVVVSAAGAVANGLCYYAFYADYPTVNTAVASAFADVAWLIQEAGLSFYSYAILVRVLRNKERLAFMMLFWTIMLVIAVLRVTILATRIRFIIGDGHEASLQLTIDHLHVGYFVSIALVECMSAAFLLRKFNSARTLSAKVTLKGSLFSYLMRSTEVRLALLAVIGITRAVTYSFQSTAQSAEGVTGQLDRFAYTLECLFPVIMFIDILASRLIFTNERRSNETYAYSRSRNAAIAQGRMGGPGGELPPGSVHMYPISQGSRRHNDPKSAPVSSDAASSQEYIIGNDAAVAPSIGRTSEIEGGLRGGANEHLRTSGGISKTVDFEITEHRIG